MAAPTVKKQAKTVRGKEKPRVTVKNVLFSPYAPEWPTIAVGETPKILQEITRAFEPYKIEVNMKKRKRTIRTGDKMEKVFTPESLERVEEGKRRKAVFRSHMELGVVCTTKALEKGHLDLVVVCRTAPPILTSHLMTLAVCRGVPAIALSRLSETVSKTINSRSMIALGFKKHSEIDNPKEEFAKLSAFIKERTPPITLPWLEYKDIPLEELRHKTMDAMKGRKGADDSSNKAPSVSMQPTEGSKRLATSQKRTSEEAGLDDDGESSGTVSRVTESSGTVSKVTESSVTVSKVTYVSGTTNPVRSVPQERKQEWKNIKKNKKKNKKNK